MQRLVVLNRSRLVESIFNGEWVVDRVLPDAGVKPGIYPLHQAFEAPTDRQERFEGTFIYADKAKVFQSLGDGRIVAYDKFAFRDQPVMGQHAVVAMRYGLADIERTPAPSRGMGLRQFLALVAILPALAFPDLSHAKGLLDFIAQAGAQRSVYTADQMRDGFTGCASLFPGEAPIALSSIAPHWRASALCSNNFAVLHSGLTKTPMLVVERLNAAQIHDARDEARTDEFFPDPRLPRGERAELADFQGSGFDRGHLSPAANQPDQRAMAQSFALSNMIPQDPTNNRKIWSKVEKDVRKFVRRARGDVFVFSGPLFEGPRAATIGANRVWVPTHLFKLVHDASSGRSWAFILENSPNARVNAPVGYAEFVQRTGWQVLGAPQERTSKVSRGLGF